MSRKRLIASVALACVFYVGCFVEAARAQPTCTAATTTPTAARDEARLSWVPPVSYVDGGTIGSPISYRVYRATGTGTFSVQCQTSAATVSLLAQPVGTQNYRVTAVVGANESAPSNVATKVIVAPTPNPPSNLSLLEQLIAWIRSVFARFA
jgi:hypothetical protein